MTRFLFGFWWHKQCELFLRFLHIYSHSQAPEALPINPETSVPAFSADGSKFAMAMSPGGVSVWDIRSKVPLKAFIKSEYCNQPVQCLQFSSGQQGKEALVFVEVRLMFTF